MSNGQGAVESHSLGGSKSEPPVSGQEFDSEAEEERVDYRDLENIDLDIECVNEALERKAQH